MVSMRREQLNLIKIFCGEHRNILCLLMIDERSEAAAVATQMQMKQTQPQQIEGAVR